MTFLIVAVIVLAAASVIHSALLARMSTRLQALEIRLLELRVESTRTAVTLGESDLKIVQLVDGNFASTMKILDKTVEAMLTLTRTAKTETPDPPAPIH